MAVSKEWTFIRTFLRKTYNREVNEWFVDVADEVLDDINVPRKAVKRACLILPKETKTSADMKMRIFREICQRTHETEVVFGIPKGELDMGMTYKPQVSLSFRQDVDDVPDDYPAMEGRLSWRIMDESTSTMTLAKLTTLANKINLEFGTNGGVRWEKGNNKVCYLDKEHGLDLRVLAYTEADGIAIIQKVCACADVTYDSDRVVPIEPKRSSDNTTTTQLILGESYKKPRWRPHGYVRFRRAVCALHGLPRPITLVDKAGWGGDALVV